MRAKRLAYPRHRSPAEGGPGTVEERETWLRFLAPIVFGIGLGLVVLLSPMALLVALGGYGDCFDAACEAGRQSWADIGTSQVGVWIVAITALSMSAHRGRRDLWLAVAAVSLIGVAAGVIVANQGWVMNPTLLGVGLPPISPAFYPWAPGAFLMSVGAVMIWLGARQAHSDR